MKYVYLLYSGVYGHDGEVEGCYLRKKDAVEYIKSLDVYKYNKEDDLYYCDNLLLWRRIDKTKVINPT